MISTGIIRPLDQLGRVTLPIELRRNLGIESEGHVEIFVEDDKIILKKHKATVYKTNDTYRCGRYVLTRTQIEDLAKKAGLI